MELHIIDISQDMLRCELYPGDPKPELSLLSCIAGGDECNMALLKTHMHAGTHADAPLHFLENGSPAIKMPLENFVGECAVVEAPPGPITGDAVDRYFPRGYSRILVKSGGRAWFDVTAAETLAMAGLKLIGTDALSVGSPGNQAAPHKAFLREGTAVLENLALSHVQPGKYFLLAQPLKISGVEAAPVRALLIDGYIFWGGKK